MAIVKGDHRIEASFSFDAAGELEDLILQVNYALKDDVTGTEEARVRKSENVWPQLSATEKNQANTIAKKLLGLATNI